MSDQLHESLARLHGELSAEARSAWERDLPFQDLLFDRWERAASLGFGAGTSIYQSSYVYGDVTVGENTWIGPMALLDGSGGLKIGDNCSISSGVQIYSHDTVRWALSGGREEYERTPTRIGSSCYIGSQSVVAMGVTIGDQCLVGACSFVNRDLPPRTIAVGIPCRSAGRVELDENERVRLVMDRSHPGPHQ